LVNGKNTFKKPQMITDGEGTKTKPQETPRNLQQAIMREMKRHVRNTLNGAILDF
jgi:hypothetical protein